MKPSVIVQAELIFSLVFPWLILYTFILALIML